MSESLRHVNSVHILIINKYSGLMLNRKPLIILILCQQNLRLKLETKLTILGIDPAAKDILKTPIWDKSPVVHSKSIRRIILQSIGCRQDQKFTNAVFPKSSVIFRMVQVYDRTVKIKTVFHSKCRNGIKWTDHKRRSRIYQPQKLCSSEIIIQNGSAYGDCLSMEKIQGENHS